DGNERPEDDWIVNDLVRHYQKRLDLVNGIVKPSPPRDTGGYQEYRALSNQLRAVERSALIALRDQNQISDDTMRHLERELDLQDVRSQSPVL
ncbi:MAG: hypothetical protein JOZ29_19945, partial [Deltaproteobacteria bacterium]|nr:hypothetical protein [Deltaproteobacteria bacterium]